MSGLKNESGMTLVEALVCAILLALGSAAVSSLITGGLVASDKHSALLHAQVLATAEIEDLRSLDYSTLASRTPLADSWNGMTFTIDSTVTRDAPDANMSTVSVWVTWSQRGQGFAYNLDSVFTDTRS
jgi:Tfp pilus assembly protein PilV